MCVCAYIQFSSVQSLTCVRLFATPWTTARQASLSITNSWRLPKLMSIESVMPTNHLILCCPLLLQSEWPSSKNLQTINAGEGMEKWDPPTLLVGVLIGAATVENSMELVAQVVKNLPTIQVTQVWSLGQEDPMEKETATHSSILAWRIPWMEEPGRLQSMVSQRVGHDWATSLSLYWLPKPKSSPKPVWESVPCN